MAHYRPVCSGLFRHVGNLETNQCFLVHAMLIWARSPLSRATPFSSPVLLAFVPRIGPECTKGARVFHDRAWCTLPLCYLW